jgi:hypothetical protein
MRVSRKPAILSLATIAAITAIASPGAAIAHGVPGHRFTRILVLRDEEQMVKVGSPVDDFFAGFRVNPEEGCEVTGLGRDLSNSRPTDVVSFSGEELVRCSEGTRIVSGTIQEIQLTVSGVIAEYANWTVELPGRCVYQIRSLEAHPGVPAELLELTLNGTARLRLHSSAAGCAPTVPVSSGADVSDVEVASVPYSTELGEEYGPW